MFSSLFATLPHAAANPTSGTIENFTDGSSSVILNTNSQATVSTNVSIFRNTTIGDATFQIMYDVSDPSPGELTLDIDSDGMFEWQLGGSGHGNVGHQTTFSTGMNSTSTNPNGNLSWIPAGDWNLPSSASLSIADITIGFTPSLDSQLIGHGNIADLAVGDMDGDGNEDAIFLVKDHIGTNSTAWPHIGWTRWDSTTSTLQTSWVGTCEGAERLITGDANGDGETDILTIADTDKTLCQHLSGSSGWSHTVNITMDQMFVDAILADLDSDGQDDLVYLHADGALNSRIFSAGAFGSSGTAASVSSGSEMPGTMDFKSITAGQFYGSGLTIVTSEEGATANYNTLWNFSANTWISVAESFECMGGFMQTLDWNSDGYEDLIGSSISGGCMATWNGTAWTTSSVPIAGLLNFTIGDHDRDGTTNLFHADSGSPDGSDTTFTGSVIANDFNGIGGIFANSTSYTPYTSPRDILFADLDGDGLDEQLIVAGESTLGLWVGAWQTVEWDLEGDGSIEMELEGYASASSPLSQSDEGALLTGLSSELVNAQSVLDFYGVSWTSIEPAVRSQGAGTFSQTGLNVTYTASFIVELNPSNMNLSNVLNDHMLLGTGNIDIPLNFTSTMDGQVTLDSVEIAWVSGTSGIQAPPAPALSLTSFNYSQVNLSWTPTSSPEDCVGYELFRAQVGTQISLFAPPLAIIATSNTTYEDMDGVTNGDWDYAVRSMHDFGIYSPLSNIIQVSVPDIPPVIDTTPPDAPVLSLTEHPNDDGKALNLSWVPSTSNDVIYTLLYLETSDFSNASTLTPVANISVIDPTTSMLMTGLTTDTDYWAAAVAVDASGNAYWNVTTVGPVAPLNNSVRSSTLSLDVTGIGLYDDGTYSGVHVKAGSPFSINLGLSSEGIPLSSETISLSIDTGSSVINIPVTTDSAGSVGHGWSDWLDFVSEANPHGGEIALTAAWPGGALPSGQAISPASASATVIVTVDAAFSTSTPSIQLDSSDSGTAMVSLVTSVAEQPLLTGLDVAWQLAGPGAVGASGTTQLDSIGSASIAVNYLEDGWIDISMQQPPWWLDISPATVQVTLTAYDHSTDPEPEPEPEPDVLEWLIVDCGVDDWVILDNSTMVQENLVSNSIQCSLTNPNPVSVQLAFSISYSESQPTFSNDLISSQNVPLANNSTLDFTIQPDAWANGTTLRNGSITIEVVVTAIDWEQASDDWILYYGFNSAISNTPDTGTDTDGTSSDSKGDSDESNTAMILIIVAVVVVLGIVGFFGMRMMMSRSEDEDEDDDEWSIPDTEPISTSPSDNELPTGRSLEELTTVTSKPKPKARKQEPEPEPEEEYWEEETEHDYTQDEDYHVDEEGVEWWKDEVGQWWYKYPDEDDWEAFEV
ncbi:MAG: hypothetical protein VX320_06450 [Candidatus Thermoplasmatota archaeon]|nr:hypothetical protein [Candidatus Thermoplasmatota archaeon]MEE3083706.1 hypothetical protein [Candidatus Thermoplasmatota archaeon]